MGILDVSGATIIGLNDPDTLAAVHIPRGPKRHSKPLRSPVVNRLIELLPRFPGVNQHPTVRWATPSEADEMTAYVVCDPRDETVLIHPDTEYRDGFIETNPGSCRPGLVTFYRRWPLGELTLNISGMVDHWFTNPKTPPPPV